LASWCLVGGAVGGVIGRHSGRLGVGLVLGSFCGVFGWALLAWAEPRERPAAASPILEQIAEPSTDTFGALSLTPLSWRSRLDEEPAIASAEQL
jgi:hypothetical protein